MITCVLAGCYHNCQCVCLVRSVFPWIQAWGAGSAYQYAGLLGPYGGCTQVGATSAQPGDVIVFPSGFANSSAGHIAVVVGARGNGDLMVLQANWSGNAEITLMAVPAGTASRGDVSIWRPPADRNAGPVALAAAQGAPTITGINGMAPFPLGGATAPPATVDEITAWYWQYLGRAPAGSDIAYWLTQPDASHTQAAIAASDEAIVYRNRGTPPSQPPSPAPAPAPGPSTDWAVLALLAGAGVLGVVGYRRVPIVRTEVRRLGQLAAPASPNVRSVVRR